MTNDAMAAPACVNQNAILLCLRPPLVNVCSHVI